MNGVVIGALMALGMVQQTDTVFPAESARRLEVESPGGSIVINAWDRNEIRVQADHSHRTHVDVRRRGDRILIDGEADRGPASIVDFVISVPRAMSVELDGMYTDMTVTGVNGEVSAETLQGDISVTGGAGSVKVSTTTGKVLVQGAQGRIDAETAAGDIRFVDVSGEISGESAGGSIYFENAQPTSVDVGTTGGRIRYEGSLDAKGTYYFGSYGGSVILVLPEGTPASMSLASIHSSVVTNLGGEMQRFRSGDRHQVDVNGGGAIVEIETFGGRIAVVRKGTEDTVGGTSKDDGDWSGLAASIRAGIRAGMDHGWADAWSHKGEWSRTRDTVPATIRP